MGIGAAQEGAWCFRPRRPCSGLWVVCGKALAVGPEKSQCAAAESPGFSSFSENGIWRGGSRGSVTGYWSLFTTRQTCRLLQPAFSLLTSFTSREGQRGPPHRSGLPGARRIPGAAAPLAPATGSTVPAPLLTEGHSAGQTAWLPVYFQASSAPAPSGWGTAAGLGRGVRADNGEALARGSDCRPLLREPRADGLMGQKRS